MMHRFPSRAALIEGLAGEAMQDVDTTLEAAADQGTLRGSVVAAVDVPGGCCPV